MIIAITIQTILVYINILQLLNNNITLSVVDPYTDVCQHCVLSTFQSSVQLEPVQIDALAAGSETSSTSIKLYYSYPPFFFFLFQSDRKAVNRYYPPDFDPNKHGSINKYRNSHPLRERAKRLSEGILVIRFEMPYNIWCGGCGKHIGMGKK